MKTFTIYLRFILLRGFLFCVFLLSFVSPFFLQNPNLTIFSWTFNNPLYYYVKDLPVWIFYVEYLISIFIISFIIILIYMLYYYDNNGHRDKTYNKILDSFIKYQFEYLFAEQEYINEMEQFEIKKLKSILNSDYKRSLFLNLLRKVNSQIIGIGRERNNHFINELNYNYLIFSYLHSPLIRHKSFALRIISDFKLVGFDKYILKMLKGNKRILHSQALISILKLSKYSNLRFLSENNIKLTVWDVNVMVKVIKDSRLDEIDYLNLLNSKNPEIVALGIILSRINKHIEFKMFIKDLISDTNKFVSKEAYFAFLSFADNQSDYDFLKYNFELTSEKAQIHIINVLSNCENKIELIKFLNYIVENKALTIKIEAIRVLMEIDLPSIERLKQSENYLIKKACLHVLDFNLE